MNSNLDERQEQKLLQIEHNGCWFAFWGLLATLIIQMALGCGLRSILGEWIIFMALALYLSVACMRNGIWDRKLKPNFKTNMIISTIASLVVGVLWFGISYHNYHKFVGAIATGVFMFVLTGALCMAGLSFSSWLYKKRVEKMEMSEEEE